MTNDRRTIRDERRAARVPSHRRYSLRLLLVPVMLLTVSVGAVAQAPAGDIGDCMTAFDQAIQAFEGAITGVTSTECVQQKRGGVNVAATGTTASGGSCTFVARAITAHRTGKICEFNFFPSGSCPSTLPYAVFVLSAQDAKLWKKYLADTGCDAVNDIDP